MRWTILVASTVLVPLSVGSDLAADDPHDPHACYIRTTDERCCDQARDEGQFGNSEPCHGQVCWVSPFADADVWDFEHATNGFSWQTFWNDHFIGEIWCEWDVEECLLVSNSPLQGPVYDCVALTTDFFICDSAEQVPGLPLDHDINTDYHNCSQGWDP